MHYILLRCSYYIHSGNNMSNEPVRKSVVAAAYVGIYSFIFYSLLLLWQRFQLKKNLGPRSGEWTW